MQLSSNILLDYIEKYNPKEYLADKDKAFSGVGLVSQKAQGLYQDQIYVTTLSQIQQIGKRDKNVCFIVVKKPQDKISEKLNRENLIFVDFSGALIDFFSYVQSIFSTIYRWCSKMDEYLIRKRSIQELLNLSEPVIGNYITISDSSFALVAYTEGLECDDPVTARLVKNGYHDQEAIDKFNKYKMTEVWRDAVDIYENTEKNISNYPTICKVIHYYNNYYSHIVMLCDNKPSTPGLKDLFKMLVDHLMVCFERQWLDNNQMPHIHDGLLISLTGPNSLSEEAARNRARNSGLPFQSNFRFMRIATEDSSNIMMQRIEREIMSYCPDAKVTLYQQSLMVLLVQPPRARDKFPEIYENLLKILARYNAHCGISDKFTTLTDVAIANEQAKIAIACSNPKEAVFFDDCYPRYLLTADPQSAYLARNTVAYNMLKTISNYDEKHGTNNFELLYVYLRYDRKATETAKTMHMHRNNVIYRIGRICEQTDLNLDDADIRFRLLLAYEIFPKTSISYETLGLML